MLNALWLGFFLVAAVAALAQWLIGGQADVFSAMVQALFAMAKLSVEVMVLLFGTLTLWLGFLRIAEKAGHAASGPLEEVRGAVVCDAVEGGGGGDQDGIIPHPEERAGIKVREGHRSEQ